MIEHTIRAFDTDLYTLACEIADLGQLDDQQIADATKSLVENDPVLASQVIATDDRVDTLRSDIEQKAIVSIARRQPLAVDLREIVGALRIANDLERVGDLAENIAKRVSAIPADLQLREAVLHFEHMAQLAREQLRCVLQSYEQRDVAGALEVWRRDEEIDALNTSLFRELLTHMMEDRRNIAHCAHLLFCAKNIERIGDHATNIAETVYYIVEGNSLAEERPKGDLTCREILQKSA